MCNFYTWLFSKKKATKKRKEIIMHFYFYLRGISHQVELFKILVQGYFFKWKRKNLSTGETEFTLVQGALRESVLGAYEYIFPEDALADMLCTFALTDEKMIGNTYTFKNAAKLTFLRRIFGAYKIPKKAFEEAKKIPASILLNDSWRGLSNLSLVHGVAVHPIGLKKDNFGEMIDPGRDNIKFFQELL